MKQQLTASVHVDAIYGLLVLANIYRLYCFFLSAKGRSETGRDISLTLETSSFESLSIPRPLGCTSPNGYTPNLQHPFHFEYFIVQFSTEVFECFLRSHLKRI